MYRARGSSFCETENTTQWKIFFCRLHQIARVLKCQLEKQLLYGTVEDSASVDADAGRLVVLSLLFSCFQHLALVVWFTFLTLAEPNEDESTLHEMLGMVYDEFV